MSEEGNRLKGYFLHANLAAALLFLLVVLSAAPGNFADENQSGNQTPTPSPTAVPIGISNVQSVSITSDSAAIAWNTNAASNSYAYYKLAADANYLNSGISDSVTSHSVQLTSLQPDSVYDYYVKSCDQDSCGDTSLSPAQFTTLQFPSPSPTLAASPSPTELPSPSPSETPSPTMEISPSPFASAIPSPSPSIAPSPSPIFSPSPSVEASPSPTAEISPSPAVVPSPTIMPSPSIEISNETLPLSGEKESRAADTACDAVTSSATLSQDVNMNFTCYNITTSSVILDCAGHTILGNSSGFGVNISKANHVVIKNCIIRNFTRGISASDAMNLTLLNNTFINISGSTFFTAGIFVNNSANSNITGARLEGFYPILSSTGAYPAFGIYLENFSTSGVSLISLDRIRGGNSSGNSYSGGNSFGICMNKSNNVTFTHIFGNEILGGLPKKPVTGSGGTGGNATGIYLGGSNNSVFENVTYGKIIAGEGAPGNAINPPTHGGIGGFSFGIYSIDSSNSTFGNITFQNVYGGTGGRGAASNALIAQNGANGSYGGESYAAYLFASQNSTFLNFSIRNVSGGDGGWGGNSAPDGGNGGIGGKGASASAFFAGYDSHNNSFNYGDTLNISGGMGGFAGSGWNDQDQGGDAGNSSFFKFIRSNNNHISNTVANYSYAGYGGLGTSTRYHGYNAISTGLFLIASNYSAFNSVQIRNMTQAGYANLTFARIAALDFDGSSFNNLTNSTLDYITYIPGMESNSIFSESSSHTNFIINSVFNGTAAGWRGSAGANNYTVMQYLAIRVLPEMVASVSIFNSSSYVTPSSTDTTAATGYLFKEITEYNATGYYLYNQSCWSQENSSCNTPHLVIASNTYSAAPAINVTMNQSRFLNITLCGSVTSSITLANPINGSGTCFNITSGSAAIDCSGYNITGRTTGHGFNISNVNHVVVKNCNIYNYSIGIYAGNTYNTTLLNNSAINITGAGIYFNNTWGNNLTSQIARDFSHEPVTNAHGNQTYAIYLGNTSASALSLIFIYRINGVNATNAAYNATATYGLYLNSSNNNTFSNIWIDKVIAADGDKASTSSGGRGGNATAIYLRVSDNSVFSNITIYNITGGNGEMGSNTTSSTKYLGGEGGYAFGFYFSASTNSSIGYSEMNNITGGKGGRGGSCTLGSRCNGANGGPGGSASMIYMLSSQNSTFSNLTMANLTSGAGGEGGDADWTWELNSGGSGGNSGHAYAIWLESTAINNSFGHLYVLNVQGANGGLAGVGQQISFYGEGGNSSFAYLSQSNNNSFKHSYMNSSFAGNFMKSGKYAAGSGFGLYATNYTYLDNVTILNITAASATGAYGRTMGIFFSGSNFNDIANSTIAVLYVNSRPFALHFERFSRSNVFTNTTFNRSSVWFNGTVINTNNMSVRWYVTLNITNSSNSILPGADINITNYTATSWPMLITTADADGLLVNQLITEYVANGTYNYPDACVSDKNISCFTPHNITAAEAGYETNSTEFNITFSQYLRIILYLASQPSTGFTLTLPGQASVAGNTSTPPDAPWTASMNFTLDSATYKEGTQPDVHPCTGASKTKCQTNTTPFFELNNTGTVDFNWYMRMNATIPPYIYMKCYNSSNNTIDAFTLANSTFNDWVLMNPEAALPAAHVHQVWCWADFNFAHGGTTGRRIDHNTTEA
ncbi:MAG: hypothetical protein V1835_06175 [Candidatus Micrarchaeota archaeon]